MASLPIAAQDIMTYGSIDSSNATSPGRPARPRMGPRHRKRTISTTEIMNEVERFSRRTISICAAPPPIISSNDVIEDDEEAAVESNPESKDRDDALSISNMETIVHILKGNIGIGVLTLPMALRNSGLIFGSLGLIFIAYLCVYCMMLLVNAAHRACEKRPDIRFLDYADTARASFQDAGGRWVNWASFIRKLLNTFLFFSQLFSNAVYALFIAQNIKPIIAHYGGETMENLNYRFYILMVLGPMLAICSIRSLRYLSPCSVVANAAQFMGLGIVFYYIFREPLPQSSSVPWMAESYRLPLFFGTAIFAIEGISVVLPIENQMRSPKDMLGWNGVLSTSMSLVVALYVGMGFYGYLKFGEGIAGSISLNLPPGDIPAQIALLLFSVSIFFSYALQFYVLMEIVGPNVIRPLVPEQWYSVSDYTTRIVINIITFALAATVPWLELVVALLGAVKMSTLSLMAPAIIDTATNWADLGKFRWKLVKNIFIFLFGFFGCIMGTYVALRDIIENFKNGADSPN